MEVLIQRRPSCGDREKTSIVNRLGLGWGVGIVEGVKGRIVVVRTGEHGFTESFSMETR
jgi:hypothetical protein